MIVVLYVNALRYANLLVKFVVTQMHIFTRLIGLLISLLVGLFIGFLIGLFLDASSHLYKRVCPLVGMSVCLSVWNAKILKRDF